MSKRKRSLPARRNTDDLSEVPTDELLNAVFRVGDELMARGVDLIDEHAKRIIDMRWEISDRMAHITDVISKLLVFINGAALASSEPNLRTILFSPSPIDKDTNLDCLGKLTGLYAQALSDWRTYVPEIADELEAELKPLAESYINALQLFKEGSDHGEMLRELARQDGMLTSLDALNKLTRTGRKRKATPISEYIFEETHKQDQLHGHTTDGATMLRFINSLENRADVQQYRADLIRRKDEKPSKVIDDVQSRVKEYSLEVQVYATVSHLKENRILAGQYLKNIRKNEKNRQK